MFYHTNVDVQNTLCHDKQLSVTMSERILSPPNPRLLDSTDHQQAKRKRLAAPDNSHQPHSYDYMALNYGAVRDSGSAMSMVPVSRAEYECLREEVATLKQALADFKSYVLTELEQIKAESRSMREQISQCHCGSCVCEVVDRVNTHTTTTPLLKGHTTNTTVKSSFVPPNNDELDIHMSEYPAMNTNRSSPEWDSGSMNGDVIPYGTDSSTDQSHGFYGGNNVVPCNSSGYNNNTAGISGYYQTGMPPASALSPSDRQNRLAQLLPNYDIWVSKSRLQIITNEALNQRDGGGALYVLRRLIPIVFSCEEMAYSRGQGLNCKSTDDLGSKDPLDPVKVQACKAYMRKFCMESGHPEPLEKAINQTFSHQVNYARRKLRPTKAATSPSANSEDYQSGDTEQQQQ